MQNTVVLDIPLEVKLIKYIYSYTYDLGNIISNKSVEYKIVCFTDTKEVVKVIIGKIEGDEYNEWSDDDKYIENLINQKVLDIV